jgi:hypothetical protein
VCDPDVDGDGLDADEEAALGTDPRLADTDGDGLGDAAEPPLGADPTVVDTDGDGLDDRVEVETHNTDPAAADTDQGGVSDFDEVEAGLDPTDPDDDWTTSEVSGGTVFGCSGGAPAPGSWWWLALLLAWVPRVPLGRPLGPPDPGKPSNERGQTPSYQGFQVGTRCAITRRCRTEGYRRRRT